MLMEKFDINYPDHIAKGFVQVITNGLDSFSDYKQQHTTDDPTTNHLGHKRMDQINKYLKEFLIEHENEGFIHDVVTAGSSPYQVLISYDDNRQNLILFKRVSSIDSLPRNMFKSPGEAIPEYMLKYVKVNERISKQLSFDLIKESDDIIATFNHPELTNDFKYKTLVLITFVTNDQEKLANVSIGIPEPEMDGWIDQVSWSHHIEPAFEEPMDKQPEIDTGSGDSDEQKYEDLIKKKRQVKNDES